ANWKISERNSGSPPLSTRMGVDTVAISSMTSRAAWVERSEGELSSVAVARQWMQRRLHPLVNSQKINRGFWFTCLCCPLPFGEAICRFPPHLNRDSDAHLRATIRENGSRGGDNHHRKL